MSSSLLFCNHQNSVSIANARQHPFFSFFQDIPEGDKKLYFFHNSSCKIFYFSAMIFQYFFYISSITPQHFSCSAFNISEGNKKHAAKDEHPPFLIFCSCHLHLLPYFSHFSLQYFFRCISDIFPQHFPKTVPDLEGNRKHAVKDEYPPFLIFCSCHLHLLQKLQHCLIPIKCVSITLEL